MVRRGEIWWTTLDPTVGSEIKKTRPAIVVQNDAGNKNSDLTIIVPLTSKNLHHIPRFQVRLPRKFGLTKESKALCNQVRSIDKKRLRKKIGTIDATTASNIDSALRIALGLY